MPSLMKNNVNYARKSIDDIVKELGSCEDNSPMGIWCLARYIDAARLADGGKAWGRVSTHELSMAREYPADGAPLIEIINDGNGRFWLCHDNLTIYYRKPSRAFPGCYLDGEDWKLAAKAALKTGKRIFNQGVRNA